MCIFKFIPFKSPLRHSHQSTACGYITFNSNFQDCQPLFTPGLQFACCEQCACYYAKSEALIFLVGTLQFFAIKCYLWTAFLACFWIQPALFFALCQPIDPDSHLWSVLQHLGSYMLHLRQRVNSSAFKNSLLDLSSKLTPSV